MKTVTNKFIAYFLATAVVVAGLMLGASIVSAASLSGGYYDTLRAANYNDNPNAINWNAEGATYASVAPGEIAALTVAYQNTGTTTATNVRIRLTPRNSGESGSHSFSARVSASNTNAVTGSATVQIDSGSQELRYVSGSARLQTLQESLPVSIQGTEDDIFSSAGILIGDIAPGDYGGLVVHYQASDNGGNQTVTPTVETYTPTQVTENSARLNGFVNANGVDVFTYFEYDTNLSDLLNDQGISTSSIPRGTGSTTFNDNISGLSPNTTYYYQACARNTQGQTVCDPHESFRTPGNNGGGNDPVNVSTDSATNIDDNSAELNGTVDSGDNIDVWFVLDDNDSTPNCSDSGIRYDLSGLYDAGQSFDRTVSGLQDDTTYYFRACGEDSDGNINSGSIRQFTTDGGNNNNNLDVVTNSANDVDDNSAELRGEYENADNGDVFFVWSDDESDVEDATRENGINQISNNVEVEIIEENADGNDSSVTETINNLDEDTRYYYALCIDQDNDLTCGSIKEFRTGGNSNGNFDPTTESPKNIDDDAATLVGSYDNADNTDIFFVWTDSSGKNDIDDVDNEDEIDDIRDKSKYNDIEIEVIENNADGDDSDVTERITGLQQDTKYYYRLCGETRDHEIECGSVKSFTTDDGFSGSGNNGSLPIVSACSASSVGISTATLSTLFEGSDNTDIYFEYGTTTGFGNRTLARTFDGSGAVRDLVSSLQPNTQYYCRVVAENGTGVTRSDIGTFRTNSLPVITSTTTRTSTTVTRTATITGNGDLVTLEIYDDEENVVRGQIVTYTVEYKNVSGRNLDEVGLFVKLPKAARYISSTEGTYNRRDHSVYEAIGELDKDEDGEMDIMVRIGGANAGEPIVAEAVLAFEDPQGDTNAFLNAIEFDSDTYASGIGLTAGLFGLGLPTTLAGWLLLLLILIAIILVARYIYNHDRERRTRIRMMEAQERTHYAANVNRPVDNGYMNGYVPNNGGNGNNGGYNN